MRDLHLRQNQFSCGIDRPLHMFIFDSFSIVEVVLDINDLDELSIFRQSIRGSADIIFFITSLFCISFAVELVQILSMNRSANFRSDWVEKHSTHTYEYDCILINTFPGARFHVAFPCKGL